MIRPNDVSEIQNVRDSLPEPSHFEIGILHISVDNFVVIYLIIPYFIILLDL